MVADQLFHKQLWALQAWSPIGAHSKTEGLDACRKYQEGIRRTLVFSCAFLRLSGQRGGFPTVNTESRPSAKESDEYYELWRDAEICDLLLAHEIEVCDDAIEMLRDDLSVAETAFVYCTREDRPLKRRDAQALIGACTRVLELADGTNLASPDDLCSVREIRQRAQVAMLTNNAPGPTARRWLWPVCVDLRHSWRLLRPHLAPTGIYDRGGPSPLLVFLTDCCRLVDPSVNEAAILKAYKHRDIDAAVLNPPQEDV